MIVIADTTPLHYLILIDQTHILKTLYGRIILPEAVRAELQAAKAPGPVKEWISHLPPWLEVRQVRLKEDAYLRGLDPGEKEAILLAQELNADALIVDDRAARREAQRRGLRVIGTLRVLFDAAEAGLLSLADAVNTLQASGFYVDRALAEEILKRHARKDQVTD